MALDFYKLGEQPFGVTPDPRYLYLTQTHRDAIEALQHGITSGRGFSALIADPGMGKTTLLFDLLGKASGAATRVFLSQPQLTAKELVRSVLEKLGIQDDSDEIVVMQRWLNECLLRESKAGKQVIVVIDEAQSLDESVLEIVRMLSNFETSKEKLLHLVLAGQPALAAMLASPRLVQLRQRISVIARLQPFDAEETKLYIGHRLRIAGHDGQTPLFTKRAVKLIAYHSGGIPRNINTLCFNALSLGGVSKTPTIDGDVIEKAVQNLDLYPFYGGFSNPPKTGWRDRFAKRSAAVPPVSSLTNRWWLKAGFALVLMGALGGILTRADWRSLHFKNPFQRTESGSSPLVPTTAVADSQASQNPQGDADLSNSATASQNASIPPSVQSLISAPASSKLSAPTFVTVKPNQTMYRICVETLGRYDDEILVQLRELNPKITDFTRIEVGQKIRIPAVQRAPKSTQVLAAQESSLRAVKAKKP
jgi:general secretion pathway protein A